MTKDTKQIPEQLLREIEIEFLRLNDFVKKNTQLTGVIEDDENQETGEE